MVQEDKIEAAKAQALRLLSYCPRSKKEIASRLKEKGFSSGIISQSVSELEDVGIIDDLKFAKSFAGSKLRRSPISIELLKKHLAFKGVEKDIIDEALLDFKDSFDEYGVVKNLIDKRLKSLRNIEPLKASRRLYGYLKRRGFSDDIISKALKEKIKDGY